MHKLAVALMLVPALAASVGAAKIIEEQREPNNAAQLKEEMEFLIDELDRVCHLTDRQIRKLEVAAKGAIQKTLETRQAEKDDEFGQFRNRFAERQVVIAQQARDAALRVEALRAKVEAEKAAAKADELADNKLAEAKVLDDIRRNVQQQAELRKAERQVENLNERILRAELQFAKLQHLPFGTGEVVPATPATQDIWLETVARVLTTQQQSLRKQAASQRREFQDSIAISSIVTELDTQLRLSDEQREVLQRLVSESANDPETSIVEIWQNSKNIRPIAAALPQNELRRALSKSQLIKWTNFNPASPHFYGTRR